MNLFHRLTKKVHDIQCLFAKLREGQNLSDKLWLKFETLESTPLAVVSGSARYLYDFAHLVGSIGPYGILVVRLRPCKTSAASAFSFGLRNSLAYAINLEQVQPAMLH
jgi:hypothetical protein